MPDLNSAQDVILQTLWLRTRQMQAYETLINVFANGLSVNPDIGKKINELTDTYLELCLPGSSEARKENDRQFIKDSAKTLKEVSDLLSKGYKGNNFTFK